MAVTDARGMKHMDRKRKFDYQWVIVAVSFLMVMTTLGFCSSPKSLFIAPVTQALGITRSAFSLSDSARYIAVAVVNVFFGALIGRFGAKKLIFAGFACLISSQIIYSFATGALAFCIGGTLLGIGLSWTTTTMVGTIVNKWCKENKGTIMGAVLAANGLGGALAIQVVTPVIEADVFGYRNAYRMVAIILAVVCALVMIFFRNSPKHDVSGYEHRGKKSRAREWNGIAYGDAVRMPYFYCTLICIFLTGLIMQSVSGVSAAHMKDCGLSPTYVATVLSLHSIALAGFKFLTGVIYDRFGIRTTVNLCASTAVVVIVLLSLVTNSLLGRVFAIIYGLFSSLALPLETIMLPIYAGEFFGQKSYDKVLGIFVSVNSAGYALGATVINLMYDRFGSYNPGFVICALGMVGVLVTMQFVIKRARKYQSQER